MYRFQICAQTQAGESIGLIGSTQQLGAWDYRHYVPLLTSGDRYPLWWVDLDLKAPGFDAVLNPAIEYKYVRIAPDGWVEWEAWGTNRWVPLIANPPAPIVVDDGWFGLVQPYPYGYFRDPVPQPLPEKGLQGLKIVVLGSSVALGCNAWLLQGWAHRLGQVLHQKYGHQLVNRSQIGANVNATIERFPQVVAPERPDIVILALSLGNEGFAYCPPHQRRAVQRRFESGLQQLIKMTRELGALPMLGGVYPHDDYHPEHYAMLQETHQRMLSWDVPVLDWLSVVDDGQGGWKPGTCFNATHPNTEGHRRMAEAIDLELFNLRPQDLAPIRQRREQKQEIPVYRDDWGFHLFACPDEKRLRVINTSKHPYQLNPSWQALQTALQQKAGLVPGVYIAGAAQPGTSGYFSVTDRGTIASEVTIPANTDLSYSAAFNFWLPGVAEKLFYDGDLVILKESDQAVRVINESDHEYNIHPMWKEIRSALKAMPAGVYEDTLEPEIPFRTLMIGPEGLESRVKAPAGSSIRFQYQCPLAAIQRIALVPLGDRCAMRMLLYKLEYDGPAYPFDLTRTTNLADVADIIASNFSEMWNPALLHYNHDARRIYHAKWSGLSFAHEVDYDIDDPLHDFSPVYERMRVRYSARSQRFLYTLQHCDQALFLRTGGTHRGAVIDLMSKLQEKCQGKPFQLMLISPQDSAEFAELPQVLHYNLEFNPDRMYDDLGYWMHCTEIMREILQSLGISSKNLFWCPPNPKLSA